MLGRLEEGRDRLHGARDWLESVEGRVEGIGERVGAMQAREWADVAPLRSSRLVARAPLAQTFPRYLPPVRTERIRLEGLPAPLLDLDIDPGGGWVGVCGEPQRPTHIVFDGATFPLSVPCLYPIVRLAGDGRAVLIGSRSRGREHNGWIVRRDGAIERSFRAGDAIEDLLVCGDRLVVTYFDEALGSPDGLDGVAVLDFDGKLVWRYRDAFGGDVLDCYCACPAGRGRVFFVGYPGFDAVLFDVTRGKRTTWPTPALVHGAHAVTVAGDTAFFHGSYGDRDILARWRFSDDRADRIGTTNGRLRGVRGGVMLATEERGYAVLSFDDEFGD